MLRLICNKKGMSMTEVLIAIVLTAIGLVTLSSLQDSGWKQMAHSDYVGRASGILYNTLEQRQAIISNPSCSIPAGQTLYIKTSGGSTAIRGDVTYTVTITTPVQINSNPESYSFTVTVTWTGNTKGISESMEVSRQDIYKSGCS